MAKPRKQKNGENQQQQQQAGGAGGGRFAEEWGTLLHQKLCLSVDMQRRRIYGHTEMKIVFPESGVVGLYADDMAIASILVNGEPAEFEFCPHYHRVDDLKWDSVTCLNSAADTACSTYLSSLDKERDPNLLISCPKIGSAVDDLVCPLNGADTSPKSPEKAEKSMKLVRINYCIETAKTGIIFGDNILCTDNQIRRARCWFPCVDNSSQQRCCYDLEFTVDMNFVAVSNGTLLYQILSSDIPPRKVYVYKLSVPVSASWVSLVVAPLDILPDSHNTVISHMCLPAKLAMLRSTIGFFHSAFSHYEDYLSMSFPFGSYKQVFVPPEMLSSSVNIAASMCTFSSEVLYDDKIIDETINTRVKLAYNLAKQWFGGYIAAESPNDEWLLDGLAGFLTDLFVRRSLGNNEARYHRYKANCTVCKADVTGATSLSSSAASDLYGTQCIGLYGKIRSWKSVAILQMLEKQIGPESFRKILQIIVRRAQDNTCSFQTLSTKEFRHLANKIGNLERPFLKEFFPRWVGSYGCPVLRLGLSYVKRKNMIELGVVRSSTAKTDSTSPSFTDNENQGVHASWPGMMSIRVHELDGMYDHPILPLSGDTTQLLEIQLHSKLASKRVQKPKKVAKPDGSDDNSDAAAVLDMRSSIESPLLWIRVDPEMEYLAEVHFHQPIQMWINQLEKDKDVVAQSEAISALKSLPQLPFSVINALNNLLNDSKAFWRIRVEAAFALAQMSSEDTDWAGLHHLVKFYKSQRFDADIGLPKPNNFHDIPEYFVLEVIPLALATIRTTDQKSPREVIEFILQLLKYNDNNGNPYSDVYWLATLVQSIGELEFGKQNIIFLPSLLKRIDRLLQFDRLMPSYNGILTVSCIHTLAQVALKMPKSVPLIHVFDHIKSIRSFGKWKIRIEANKSLMDLEFHVNGLDAALSLFLSFIEEESSYQGHRKLASHALHLCEANINSSSSISRSTLVSLLRLLTGRKAFDNIYLRHYLFCILQIIAGRSPTLYGISRAPLLHPMASEASNELNNKIDTLKKRISGDQENSMDPLFVNTTDIVSDVMPVTEVAKDADTISNSTERRVLKIRVKPPISGKADGIHNVENSRGWHDDTDLGPSSSVSVDAPQRPIIIETGSGSHQIIEEVNSRDPESRTTASVGSAKLMIINEMAKELQCTADSRNGSLPEDRSSPVFKQSDLDANAQKSSCPQSQSFQMPDEDKPSVLIDGQEQKEREKKEKKDKKHKDKKRKRENEDRDRRNDPEYLERKRLKKEKKRLEKERGKILVGESFNALIEVENRQITACSKENSSVNVESSYPSMTTTQVTRNENVAGNPPTKVRIKIKSRSLAD